MKHLQITARRWFSKSCGNTYHSVTCSVDGKQVARVDYAYGYDSHWQETAKKALREVGILPTAQLDADGHPKFEQLHSIAESAGLTYDYEVIDVKRKKDL